MDGRSRFGNSQTVLVCVDSATRYASARSKVLRPADLPRTADPSPHLHAYGSSSSTRRLARKLTIREYNPIPSQRFADNLQSKVEDLSRFILIVDLADVESLQESNLVHHLSSANPSIGSTFPGAYPHTQIAVPSGPVPTEFDASRFTSYETPYQTNGYSANGSSYSQGYTSPQVAAYPAPQASGSGSCSRNLIGSLSATAFRLYDTEGRPGLWFVFQDLSIRTEGMFRLKFTFFDLMCNREPLAPPSGDSLADYSPLLASAYSAPFQVWSAKKFPGVRQTTDLSQCFADQGIKIPVRKAEGKGEEKKRKHREGNSDDEGEEYE